MPKWDWLEKPQTSPTWGFLARTVVKAAVLFVLCNIVFALTTPLEALGRLSLYNTVLPGRERLPYGENPALSYNVTLFNLPTLFASHTVNRDKGADEFRLLLIGDSATWGWRLDNADTLAGQINAAELTVGDGRRIVAYNLAYPSMTLTKDLLLLDYAMRYEPDLIVWPVTLRSFPRETQYAISRAQSESLVLSNPSRVRALIVTYHLNLDADDKRFPDPDFWDNTIVGQRRNLADLLRLQFYGFSWASTNIDQYVPANYEPLQNDFDEDTTYLDFSEEHPFTLDDLALDVLAAGVERAADTPVLIVNEPIYRADGANSDRHYNSFYPRWAYDHYREMLAGQTMASGWTLLDLWNAIPRQEFTDTPVHLTPEGSSQYAGLVAQVIEQMLNP